MLKYYFMLTVLILLTVLCNAQERYTEALFDEVSVETLTYTTKDSENLELDIYLPQADSEEKRATIIYVHGGGFSGGQRDQKSIVDFCTRLANHGYVVASMSYRLTRKGKPEGFGCDCPANEKLNTFYAAVEDVQDATFFLIENRHQFGINPQKIILAGSSAGAETVLNTAYQPPFCYGLDSGPVSFAGVISMAGAVPDTTAIYDQSAVPSLLFHGTDDPLVPYATASHHYCDKEKKGYLILHGSYTIAKKLKALEVPCWLHTSCGLGHELHSQPFTDYFDVIIEFCNTFVIQNKGDQRHTIVKGKQNKDDFQLYNFCSE
jgi:acetyl esterase/lipase